MAHKAVLPWACLHLASSTKCQVVLFLHVDYMYSTILLDENACIHFSFLKAFIYPLRLNSSI